MQAFDKERKIGYARPRKRWKHRPLAMQACIVHALGLVCPDGIFVWWDKPLQFGPDVFVTPPSRSSGRSVPRWRCARRCGEIGRQKCIEGGTSESQSETKKRHTAREGARTALQHWHVQSWLTAAFPVTSTFATAVEGASDKTATKRAAAERAAQPLRRERDAILSSVLTLSLVHDNSLYSGTPQILCRAADVGDRLVLHSGRRRFVGCFFLPRMACAQKKNKLASQRRNPHQFMSSDDNRLICISVCTFSYNQVHILRFV